LRSSRMRKPLNGESVDTARRLRVGFGLVDCRVGGRIDDDVRRFRPYNRRKLVRALEIRPIPVRDGQSSQKRKVALKLPTYLTTAAEKQYLHRRSSVAVVAYSNLPIEKIRLMLALRKRRSAPPLMRLA